MHKSEPTKPAETRRGPAVYATHEEAEEAVGWWTQEQGDREEKKMVKEDFTIRPCKMSVERGIELIIYTPEP
jgi:hypothetical protein